MKTVIKLSAFVALVTAVNTGLLPGDLREPLLE